MLRWAHSRENHSGKPHRQALISFILHSSFILHRLHSWMHIQTKPKGKKHTTNEKQHINRKPERWSPITRVICDFVSSNNNRQRKMPITLSTGNQKKEHVCTVLKKHSSCAKCSPLKAARAQFAWGFYIRHKLTQNTNNRSLAAILRTGRGRGMPKTTHEYSADLSQNAECDYETTTTSTTRTGAGEETTTETAHTTTQRTGDAVNKTKDTQRFASNDAAVRHTRRASKQSQKRQEEWERGRERARALPLWSVA